MGAEFLYLVGMKRTSLGIAVLVALLLTGSCGGAPDVDWSMYAPQVRERVDDAVAAKSCRDLQDEFDSANESSDVHRVKYGEGNGDLMSYINWHMSELNCP